VLDAVNVDAGADIADEGAIVGAAGSAGVVDPAILAVMPPQPILHAKRRAGVEMTDVDPQATVEIVGMHAVGPAVAELLRHGAPGEGEPRPIEPGAELVGAGDPDHDRSSVHRRAKARIEVAWRVRVQEPLPGIPLAAL